MQSYSDMTPLWDLSQPTTFSALPDDDFLALLQKQFPNNSPSGIYAGGNEDGVNPQSLSKFPLPSLSPLSDDSSPSPPSANPQRDDEDGGGGTDLKRKATYDDLGEGPSQKNQHTATGSKKGTSTKRKTSGSGLPDESRLMKRKEQNRAAQRAFRERREKHVKDLEDKVAALEAKNEATTSENENLKDLLARLQKENMALKQSQFTFSVPNNTANAGPSHRVGIYTTDASMFSNLPRTQYHSFDKVSPGNITNPLDLSSLMSFDPNVLNLLAEPPQQTATDGATQMDFGFNNGSGHFNQNFTTITTNPQFFSLSSFWDNAPSFASTQSQQQQPSQSTPTNSPANNHQQNQPNNSGSNSSMFNFDIGAMSSWSSPSNSLGTDVNPLDDLFGSYLGPQIDMNFMPTSTPSSSFSPVVHHSSLNQNSFANFHSPPSVQSTSSGASPQSDPSLFGTPRETGSSTSESEVGQEELHECPKTRQDLANAISSEGPSLFAPSPSNTLSRVRPSIVACGGESKLPRTMQNEDNVEVLKAWKRITSDPQYKECDINELCSEFTAKAKCDGSKVVLEPQGVQDILKSLATKKTQHGTC